jgi:uncharacterized membrane protein (DUF4010 family)
VNEALPVFESLGLALLLGMLVGLQRESVDSPLGGVRTFPLATVLGAFAALLAKVYGGWIVAAGFLGVLGAIIVRSIVRRAEDKTRAGLTTMIAMLVMYAIGAYLVDGYKSVAVVAGGAVAVLLQLKPQLHGFVARLGESDLKAIMQFVLISCVILPILPNQTFDPLDVLNPFQIWLMVVLVVGISLGGYVVYKFFGERAGTMLGGVLGGMISSTATTFSYARRTTGVPSAAASAAFAILVATGVSFVRIITEIAAVAPKFLISAAAPLTVLFLVTAGMSALLWFRVRGNTHEMPPQGNPTELRSALIFAAIYAIVLVAVAAAKKYFEDRGLYVVATISGLTEMDAITVATSRMVQSERLEAAVGWRVIVVGALANLVFKAGVAGIVGNRMLLWRVAGLFGVIFVAGLLLVALWP